MSTLDGFDVSHHQVGLFPWAWSRGQGHRLAGWKVTQRDNFLDPQAARNRAEAAVQGFPYRAMYHWQSPLNEASLEAQLAWFVANVGELQVGEFIQLDQEDGNGKPTLSLDDCRRGMELWNERYPGRVCHYGYGGYNNGLHYKLNLYPWWRASATNLPAGEKVAILQWGQTPVPGIDGGVDSNEIVDELLLRKLCGYKETPMPYFADLEVRSRVLLDSRAKYVFGSELPADASVGDLFKTGVDCAQAMAWVYGPWMTVPDYTGSIWQWATRTNRLVPMGARRPGDLVLRPPNWFDVARMSTSKIGHVGMVLQNIDVIRQARSTAEGCGDWGVNANKWASAVSMGFSAEVPAPVDLVAVGAAMAAAKQAVTKFPLKLMSTGLAVSVVQDKLHVPQTGTYDYATIAAVDAFQRWWNTVRRPSQPELTVDGVVGPVTWGALFGEYV